MVEDYLIACLSSSRRRILSTTCSVENQVGNMNLMSSFPFVPDLFMAFFYEESQMFRFLSQDWVSTWQGWQYLQSDLETCVDDEEAIVKRCMQDFARITLQNQTVAGKSDAERRSELEESGIRIGVGLVHNNNECCSDSLLQLLASLDLVDRSFRHDPNARRVACASADL